MKQKWLKKPMMLRRTNKMERHKLWNDRAEKLMRKTFESWSKDKKKKVYEVGADCADDETEELDESPRYGEEYADMDGEEPQGNDNPSQDVYAMLDNLRSKVVGTPLEGDVLAIMDKMDANPEMTDTKYGDHTMAEEFGDQGQLSKDMDKARASSDKRSDAVGGRITNVSKLQDVMVSQVRGLMQSAEKVGEKELTLVLRNLLKNVNQLVPQEGGGEIAEGISAKIKTLQSKLNALKKK